MFQKIAVVVAMIGGFYNGNNQLNPEAKINSSRFGTDDGSVDLINDLEDLDDLEELEDLTMSLESLGSDLEGEGAVEMALEDELNLDLELEDKLDSNLEFDDLDFDEELKNTETNTSGQVADIVEMLENTSVLGEKQLNEDSFDLDLSDLELDDQHDDGLDLGVVLWFGQKLT